MEPVPIAPSTGNSITPPVAEMFPVYEFEAFDTFQYDDKLFVNAKAPAPWLMTPWISFDVLVFVPVRRKVEATEFVFAMFDVNTSAPVPELPTADVVVAAVFAIASTRSVVDPEPV